MGWCSGSGLLSQIMQKTFPYIDPSDRKDVAEALISIFESKGCDTLKECMGEFKEYDQAYREMNPQDFDEED